MFNNLNLFQVRLKRQQRLCSDPYVDTADPRLVDFGVIRMVVTDSACGVDLHRRRVLTLDGERTIRPVKNRDHRVVGSVMLVVDRELFLFISE